MSEDISKEVFLVLTYFGPQTVDAIVEKLKMRGIVVTNKDVQEAAKYLIAIRTIQQSGDLFKIKEIL